MIGDGRVKGREVNADVVMYNNLPFLLAMEMEAGYSYLNTD